jgi:hypothetical protein
VAKPIPTAAVRAHLAIADTLAIGQSSGFYLLVPARVSLDHLLIGHTRELQSGQSFRAKGPTVGSPQSGAKVNTLTFDKGLSSDMTDTAHYEPLRPSVTSFGNQELPSWHGP